MDSFMKRIWSGKAKDAHHHFIRFGKGIFEGRAALSLQKSSKIKFGGSFEWANDFAELCCELDNKINISGTILTKEDISNEISKKGIKAIGEEKKGGLFYKYNLDEQEVNSFNLKEIIVKSYYTLLDINGNGFSLKTKQNLPKPGKSGDLKIDDKFCILEADIKYWNQIKEAFMLPECKKCKIRHSFVIENIIIPKDEKDFEKASLLSKRKGKIIRKSVIEKQPETQEEVEFEA